MPSVPPPATSADDPWGGPAPIVYLGPGLACLLALTFASGYVHLGPVPITAAVLTAAAVTAAVVRVALARQDRRAAAAVRAAHRWLLARAGQEATGRAAAQLPAPGQFTRFVEAWQQVRHVAGLPTGEFDRLLTASVLAGQYALPAAVLADCHPRTEHGSRTDQHAVDVTGQALCRLLTTGQYTPAQWRTALRGQLAR